MRPSKWWAMNSYNFEISCLTTVTRTCTLTDVENVLCLYRQIKLDVSHKSAKHACMHAIAQWCAIKQTISAFQRHEYRKQMKSIASLGSPPAEDLNGQKALLFKIHAAMIDTLLTKCPHTSTNPHKNDWTSIQCKHRNRPAVRPSLQSEL